MKNKKVIALIVVLAFFAGGLILRELLFRPAEQLAIVSTQPSLYQTDVFLETKVITFQFNQDIEEVSLLVNIYPDCQHQLQKEADLLSLTLEENLKPDSDYLVEVKSETGFYFPLEFHTVIDEEAKAAETASSGQGDPEAEQIIAEELATSYPLFYQTPKKTALWTADYSQKLELTVTYQSGQALKSIQDQVFAWMESEGINPQTHNFKWKVASSD